MHNFKSIQRKLVTVALCASGVSGCALAAVLSESVGTVTGALGDAFAGPTAQFQRPVPADQDLAEVGSVALGRCDGEGAEQVQNLIRIQTTASARFDVLQDETLRALNTEYGCNEGDLECLVGVAPGLAVFGGVVHAATYEEEVVHSDSQCLDSKGTRPCIAEARTGVARVEVELALRGSGGKALASRTVSKEVEKVETSNGDKAKAIDSSKLIAQAREEAVAEFMALVNPRRESIDIELSDEDDDSIPELASGTEKLSAGVTKNAIRQLRRALVKANAGEDEDLKAAAHYNLGVALLIEEDYDGALTELKAANAIEDDSAWAELIADVPLWKEDAARFTAQLALRKRLTPTVQTVAKKEPEGVGPTLSAQAVASGDASAR